MTQDLLLAPPNTRGASIAPRVIKRLERKIQDEETPLISKYITWCNLLEFVYEGENLLLGNETNQDLKMCHHTIIETSIVLGEALLSEENIEEVLSNVGCTRDDFKAKIEILRHKDRIWHGDLTSEKAEDILKDVFGP